jgi:adenylate cyclase
LERRLAAILAADVVGYTRLMGEDEVATLAALKAHRQELFEPAIAARGGRIVKLIGDGILAEFPSAVEAVECAVEIQEAMAARNADLPDERQLTFRMGINVGDVVVEEDDLYGDGVNIAARLEGLANPGGICLARNVFDQVKAKVDREFEDLGGQDIKNIAEPVHVFRVCQLGFEVAQNRELAAEAVDLHHKPSIAVLPFTNMSGDPEQEYFADGITEDIITELARFQNLLVIARNSVFTYKGKAVRVEDVGRELGVDYVAEGSIRKAGNRVRVTIQLIDAETGNHVWAERYDRDLADIFDLQDELTQTIVAALPRRLESADVERIRRKPPSNMGVYERVLRAKLCHHRGSSEDNSEAIQLLDEAIELDPEYASAYAWKACTLTQAWARGYCEGSNALDSEILDLTRKAVSLDENDLECVRILSEYGIEEMRFDDAQHYNEKALRMNPNDPRLIAQRGEIFTWLGRPEEGVEWVEKAMQLDPYDADAWAHLLGRALFGARRYEEAIRAFKRIPRPHYGHYAFLAASYGQLDREEEAKAEAAQVLAMKPDFTAKNFTKSLFYKEQLDREHLMNGLRKAGLPE